MVPPIIVLENGDLSLFASVEDVSMALEAIDVQAGRFLAYDATGSRLLLDVVADARISVTQDPAGARDPQSLERALRNYLDACGLNVPITAMLDELVGLAVDNVGFSG